MKLLQILFHFYVIYWSSFLAPISHLKFFIIKTVSYNSFITNINYDNL